MTPTPAQIEAAARQLFVQDDGNASDWDGGLTDDLKLSYRLDAKAALAAAAEVGGSDIALCEYTIERCAKVADEYAKRYDLDECLEVAAAIRALAK